MGTFLLQGLKASIGVAQVIPQNLEINCLLYLVVPCKRGREDLKAGQETYLNQILPFVNVMVLLFPSHISCSTCAAEHRCTDQTYLSLRCPIPCFPSRWVLRCFFITKAHLQNTQTAWVNQRVTSSLSLQQCWEIYSNTALFISRITLEYSTHGPECFFWGL